MQKYRSILALIIILLVAAIAVIVKIPARGFPVNNSGETNRGNQRNYREGAGSS
jgi:hypothetical protein